jgi:hypothetical protein
MLNFRRLHAVRLLLFRVDGIASAHLDELSVALPGFAAAMAWPG